jgi:DNA-binding XRE family transcriptional regulator
MLMPVHARMARAALRWSLENLKEKTGLSKTTLVRFEAGLGVYQSTAMQLEVTFARAGVVFIYESETNGPGVQLSKELSRKLGTNVAMITKVKSARRSQKAK